MLVYLFKKYIWVFLLILVISILFYTTFNKWKSSVVSVQDFPTYFSTDVDTNNISIKIFSKDYDNLITYLQNNLPPYLWYNIEYTPNIVTLQAKITLMANKEELDNTYHSNYDNYLTIKQQLLDIGIVSENDFDSNNKLVIIDE